MNIFKEMNQTMNIKIDARGLACPKPVINTKRELDNLEEGVVVTIV
ncbi:sulfurtransferase TusA family protein, partial [Clostridioides difficile]